MKIVFTIVIILVYIATMMFLFDGLAGSSDAISILSLAGMIALTYGGYKLIQFIFKQ
jgi:hypothetical protein